MECEHINSLPEEILIHIFLLFSVQELSSILAFVCSKWHAITRRPSLWRRVNSQLSLCSAIRLFRTAPLQQLRELSVDKWEGACADVIVSLIAENCPALRKLQLSSARQGTMKLTKESLGALARFCPQLAELDLGLRDILHVHYYCRHSRTNKQVFAQFSQLKVLSLALDYGYDDYVPDLCTNLTSLNVAVLPPAPIKWINAFLSTHKSVLTTFQFKDDGRRPDAKFFKALRNCTSLRSILFTSVTGMRDKELAAIADLPHLTELTIESSKVSNTLTTGGIVSAFSAHSPMCNLKKLCLKVNKNDIAVTDRVATAIANHCPQLVSLELNNCTAVTDRGVREIVTQCHCLQHLLLPGLFKLTKRSLQTISGSLPQLLSLNIADCFIERSSVQEYVKLCPKVNVILKAEEVEDVFSDGSDVSTSESD